MNPQSKYVGVYWHKSTKRWCAYYQGHIGLFDTEEEAALARSIKRAKKSGEYIAPLARKPMLDGVTSLERLNEAIGTDDEIYVRQNMIHWTDEELERVGMLHLRGLSSA